jgi:nucleoid-associated protein YgaU
MPVTPDSRFAGLPVLRVVAPDGGVRQAVALRLGRREPGPRAAGRHVVRHGEELDALARAFYGSERLWWRLLDANPVFYPFDLKPGDVLSVPDAAAATRATRARSF